MTDFFILAVAVFLAVVVVRALTAGWPKADAMSQSADGDQEDHA